MLLMVMMGTKFFIIQSLCWCYVYVSIYAFILYQIMVHFVAPVPSLDLLPNILTPRRVKVPLSHLLCFGSGRLTN